MTEQAIYLKAFFQDVEDTIAWSEERFGEAAADRYGELIRQALRDVTREPLRPGVRTRPDLGQDAYTYHLLFSRRNTPEPAVRRPRHLLLYRWQGRRVEFARLLHDRRELRRHMPDVWIDGG